MNDAPNVLCELLLNALLLGKAVEVILRRSEAGCHLAPTTRQGVLLGPDNAAAEGRAANTGEEGRGRERASSRTRP
eukprot:CAMPEP_0115551808 /NCGR_PEP_ID=MMETSP0271-20121206/95917_1 /TAXON_ID=71861 /ORGANISM="Scrippsiella trochoidea, Strain CCMP3099" /LENGTH=75 /DNA_ID=CAMNT_0002985411 /DNA_START=739 /DNA_END=962 /DNA_ORIENTATION=+